MNTIGFSELLEKRRSIRKYQEKEVPLELLKEMLKDATYAPSAGNGQPWKFIIVNDTAVMKRISDESKKNLLARIAATPEAFPPMYKTMLEKEHFNVFFNAPSLVIVVGEKHHRNLFVDCALAVSYFMMSAVSRGLGTCWVNFGMAIEDPALREELCIPDNCDIIAPVIVGYPEHIPAMPPRKEPEILALIPRSEHSYLPTD